mmetsp:Transcript_64437/g.185177  ORF Transcript_64437/g.185177 Transcript_64437/m.185177 type:complete len:254 (+) Transcript_64437:401-1162(+)
MSSPRHALHRRSGRRRPPRCWRHGTARRGSVTPSQVHLLLQLRDAPLRIFPREPQGVDLGGEALVGPLLVGQLVAELLLGLPPLAEGVLRLLVQAGELASIHVNHIEHRQPVHFGRTFVRDLQRHAQLRALDLPAPVEREGEAPCCGLVVGQARREGLCLALGVELQAEPERAEGERDPVVEDPAQGHNNRCQWRRRLRGEACFRNENQVYTQHGVRAKMKPHLDRPINDKAQILLRATVGDQRRCKPGNVHL